MAKLPSETLETIWTLLKHLSKLVEDATEAEYVLFERFGETQDTIPSLEELKGVAIDAASRYSQLSNLRLRIAEAQPIVTNDMLRLLSDLIGVDESIIEDLEAGDYEGNAVIILQKVAVVLKQRIKIELISDYPDKSLKTTA